MNTRVYFVDNAQSDTTGMSGGDRIAIELGEHWSRSGKAQVSVVGSNLTETLWKKCAPEPSVEFVHVSHLREGENLFFSYLKRVLRGIWFSRKLEMDRSEINIVYTASDFWPDAITGLFMYLRNRDRCRWIAGFYLFAPNPFKGFVENGSWGIPSIRSLLYSISQKPVYLAVKIFASMVFVTNENDIDAFVTASRSKDKVIAVRGGVDTETPARHAEDSAEEAKSIDAVFVGRFHPQKGIVELIDIWKMVCDQIPDARLAVIGIGPLEKEVRQRISDNDLDRQVQLYGYLDGMPKYEVFKISRLILHPALYDSGGMAAAEGMAWGLPGVSYDLPALRTYYPRGMVKVPVGKPERFAEAIIELLRNNEMRRRIGEEARQLTHESWSWPQQAKSIWQSMESAGMLLPCNDLSEKK